MRKIFETPLLLGDTGGKPGVFTSFLLDLGSPVVGGMHLFHGSAILCEGWARIWRVVVCDVFWKTGCKLKISGMKKFLSVLFALLFLLANYKERLSLSSRASTAGFNCFYVIVQLTPIHCNKLFFLSHQMRWSKIAYVDTYISSRRSVEVSSSLAARDSRYSSMCLTSIFCNPPMNFVFQPRFLTSNVSLMFRTSEIFLVLFGWRTKKRGNFLCLYTEKALPQLHAHWVDQERRLEEKPFK